MNELVYNILSYASEWAKLTVVCIGLLGLEISGKKQAMASGFLSLLFIIIGTSVTNFDKDLLFLIFGCVAILSVICALYQKKDSIVVILAYIWICNIDIVILFLCQYIIFSETSVSGIGEVALNSVSLLFFALGVLLIRKKKSLVVISQVPKRYLILITIGCLAIGMYISSLELFAAQEGYNAYVKKAIFWVMLGSLIFVAVGITCIQVLVSIQKMVYEKKYHEKLMESQEKYYVDMLEKIDDTRRFRHDIREHLYCMQVLLSDKKIHELEEYFDKINGAFQEIDMGIKTGSRIVDVIINDLNKQFEDVNIVWSGKLHADIVLDQVSACTIFYNLLKNAMEGAEHAEQKEVMVTVKQLEKKNIVVIQNSYTEEPRMVAGKFVSKKKEYGHGYGMTNVQECLQRVGGLFQFEYGNNLFKTKLIIPIA